MPRLPKLLRAYLRHLLTAGRCWPCAWLCSTICTLYNELMARIRQALDEGTFDSFRRPIPACWIVPLRVRKFQKRSTRQTERVLEGGCREEQGRSPGISGRASTFGGLPP